MTEKARNDWKQSELREGLGMAGKTRNEGWDRDNGGLPEGPPFENDSSFRPVKPEEAKPENEDDFPNLDDLLQDDKTESFRPPVSAEPGKTEDPLDSPSPAPTGKPESDAGEASSGSESEARPALPEPVEGESVPVPELILPEDTRKPAQADQSPEVGV